MKQLPCWNTLKIQNFASGLIFFHLVMPHVDVLYSQLQNRHLDASKVQTYLANFTSEVNKIRNSNPVQSMETETEHQSKRKIASNTQSRVAAAKELCDVILTQTDLRFQFKEHLCISTLLQETRFENFRVSFPEKKMLNKCVELFPVFDKDKLRTELTVIYSR